MDKTQVLQFISEQKTAFIGSINEQGYPVIRAIHYCDFKTQTIEL